MDREWYEVHRGSASDEYEHPNEASANKAAQAWAEDTDDAVCVVYCRRTEIRSFQRRVTVTATDVASVPALSAEGRA